MRLALLLRSVPLAALLSASPSLLPAQTPFFGPRAAGMAGAMTAVADDGTALWTNPAGLARDPRTDLDLFGGAVASERGALREFLEPLSGLDLAALSQNPSAILPVIGDLAALAQPGTGIVGSGAAGLVFGWSGLALGIGDTAYAGVYPNVDLTHVLPGEDPDTSIRFNDTAIRSAGLEAREVRLGLSKAFLQRALLVGVTGRYVMGRTYYVSQSVFDLDLGNPMTIARRALQENPRNTNRFTFDAGAMLNILGKVRVAVVSTSVNEPSFAVTQDPSNPDLEGAPESLKLPRTLRAGVAFEPIGALTLAVDGDLVANDTLIPGGQSQQISAGIEVSLPLFAIRAGAFRDVAAPDPHWAYSAGFGIGLPQLSVNGAVVLSTYQGLSLSSANQRDVGAALNGRFRF
ncbi:MAG: hypothetical protein ACRD3M_11120 [Thermoanaerobaculia bacterium]